MAVSTNIRHSSPAAVTAVRGCPTLPLKPSPPPSRRRPGPSYDLLDGCDFEHWLVVFACFDDGVARDEIIDTYIKTLAMVVGSKDEARMKFYSVSTNIVIGYWFGVLASEELAMKILKLPGVRYVFSDSYLIPEEKQYGGEPFINGQAVSFDPKYHYPVGGGKKEKRTSDVVARMMMKRKSRSPDQEECAQSSASQGVVLSV